jgi:hypothetical protein
MILSHLAAKPDEIIKGVKSGRVPVRPDGLDSITTDVRDASKLKRLRWQWLVRPFVEIPHYVHFTFAASTGTMPPQAFQSQITLGAVVPFNGKFLTDLLNVLGSHQP